MNASPDSVIASLLAQHATEQAAIKPPPVVTVTVSWDGPKVKPIKPKALPSPIHRPLSAAAVGSLPAKGTLDAAAFMAAVRSAGRRLNDGGFPYTDQDQVRGDLIKAIAGYVGYDPRGEFGSQESAARAQAMRDLRVVKVIAGKSREEQRSAARSLQGFVAGLPDNIGRKLANLRGQAEAATDTLIECEKNGNDVGAAIERERLSHIYAQIKEMGF